VGSAARGSRMEVLMPRMISPSDLGKIAEEHEMEEAK
jgi:hypothetical protein